MSPLEHSRVSATTYTSMPTHVYMHTYTFICVHRDAYTSPQPPTEVSTQYAIIKTCTFTHICMFTYTIEIPRSQSHTCSNPAHMYLMQTRSHVYAIAYINAQMPVGTTHSSVSGYTGLHIHIHVHTTYMYTCTIWAHTGIFKLGLSDSSQPCLMHYLSTCKAVVVHLELIIVSGSCWPPQPPRASEWLEGPP